MQLLVYAIIASALSFDYLTAQGYAPRYISYAQELVAILAAAVVVVVGVQQRFRDVPPVYWLVLGGLLLSVSCALIVNGVGTGPTFAGIRTYLRAMPLFFLPMVVQFSEKQLKRQLMLILAFALAQLPVALDQRLTTFERGFLSGDRTFGTVMNSGHLSIFLICVASVILAFYLRRRLSLKWTLILTPLVLAPTFLNETKATLLLVPVAAFSVMVLGANKNRMRKAIAVVVMVAAFLAVFIPVYDYFMRPRWGYGIVDFFMMEGRVENYLSKDVTVGTNPESDVGRVDAITVPLRELSRDPSLLAFGLGIGNVSTSAIGSQFDGEHFQRYGHFIVSFASLLLWETGIIGFSLVVFLCCLVLIDAYRVSRGEGLVATLALGTLGGFSVLLVSLPYRSLIDSGALIFLSWYFAGVIVAERMRAAVRVAASHPVARGHRGSRAPRLVEGESLRPL